jgi:hypothetical protein
VRVAAQEPWQKDWTGFGCVIRDRRIFPVLIVLCAKRVKAPWEVIYFKLYKSQIPVVEQALETVALMLGSAKSRGYCLEMICADFLAGAATEKKSIWSLGVIPETALSNPAWRQKKWAAQQVTEGPWKDCVRSDHALSWRLKNMTNSERTFYNVTDGSANVAGYQEIFTSIIWYIAVSWARMNPITWSRCAPAVIADSTKGVN